MKSLSDVVGAAGLQGYAEVALILFLVVFIAVVLRVLASRREEMDRIARLPLDDADAPIAPPRATTTSMGSGDSR